MCGCISMFNDFIEKLNFSKTTNGESNVKPARICKPIDFCLR